MQLKNKYVIELTINGINPHTNIFNYATDDINNLKDWLPSMVIAIKKYEK